MESKPVKKLKLTHVNSLRKKLKLTNVNSLQKNNTINLSLPKYEENTMAMNIWALKSQGIGYLRVKIYLHLQIKVQVSKGHYTFERWYWKKITTSCKWSDWKIKGK